MRRSNVSFSPHLSTWTMSHFIRCQRCCLHPVFAARSTSASCQTQTDFCSPHLLRTSFFATSRFSCFLCNCLVSVWFRVSAAGYRSCLTAIRRKNKAFISGQRKYAYFCRLSQLLRIPASQNSPIWLQEEGCGMSAECFDFSSSSFSSSKHAGQLEVRHA